MLIVTYYLKVICYRISGIKPKNSTTNSLSWSPWNCWRHCPWRLWIDIKEVIKGTCNSITSFLCCFECLFMLYSSNQRLLRSAYKIGLAMLLDMGCLDCWMKRSSCRMRRYRWTTVVCCLGLVDIRHQIQTLLWLHSISVTCTTVSITLPMSMHRKW